MSEFEWNARVGCEGGPVIIASHDTFMQWTGGRALPLEQRSSLHVWGQFTGELPEKFRPEGPTGHQFIPASGRALVDLRDELVATVKDSWPDAEVSLDDEGAGRILRKDYKQLWFNLAPLSEYERCWQDSGEGREAWYHSWDARKALFWEVEGGGVVDIGIAERSELILLRTWVNDEQGQKIALKHVTADGVEEEKDLPPFEVGPILTVCWAQADSAEIEGIASAEDIENSANDENPPSFGIPGIGGVGTALRIVAGSYDVSHGYYEEDDWASRWCRLRLK